MMISGAGVLIGAVAAGCTCMLVARCRVPARFRSLRTSLAVSMPCLTAKHDRCFLHLNCPCACHDEVLHYSLLTDPQLIPHRRNHG